MKKISFQRRNAWFSPSGLSLGFLGGAIVVVVFGLRIFFPNAFFAITTPLFRVGSGLTSAMTDLRASFADSAALMRTRDALTLENVALTNQNLLLTAKVDNLTALLGQSTTPSQGIIASVLSRPPESPYDLLIIAAGSTSGVSTGMRAFAPGDVPIGEVESVIASSAKVALYSSPGHTLPAWVGSGHIPVTLTGAGGGAFSASAPKAAGVAEGDLVYIGSTGASPIGRVTRLSGDLSSPSTTLLITPLVNLFSIVWIKLLP